MDISIVIPNHNGEHLLKKNIPAVIAAVESFKTGNVEVIVTDDASVDDSRHVINSYKVKYKHIHLTLLESKQNRGFSTNVNKAVAKASGDIIVLLNSDVTPERGFLERVVNHFLDKHVFAVGFMDKSIEKNGFVLRGRGIGKWDRWIVTHNRGDVMKHDSFWASGGSSAYRKDIWNMLGGFYEIYNPFYWEDVDLSYRAMKAGFKIEFDPDIVMRHEHEIGSIRTAYSDDEIKKIAYRNQLLFVWLNITDNSLMTRHIIWLAYYSLKALLSNDPIVKPAISSAIKKLPEVLRFRSRTAKMSTLSDTQILSSFKT